jgi:uncharacterized protein
MGAEIGSYWERGNQNEIHLVAVNDMKKTITMADIKLSKSRLSVENIADYLPESTQ